MTSLPVRICAYDEQLRLTTDSETSAYCVTCLVSSLYHLFTVCLFITKSDNTSQKAAVR